jgi:hypothetical protein
MTMMNTQETFHSGLKLCVLLILWLPVTSFATNYYVSSTGNDAHSGTSVANAWASITQVNATIFLPGDALYFEGGQTFTGNIFLSAGEANDPSNIFTISSYGTGQAIINAGNSYGFYAYNTQGFSISNIIFDGNSTSTNTGAGVLIFSDLPGDLKFSNISLSNLEIRNFGGEGVKIYTTQNLTGYQNVTMSNLIVHDVMKNGIIVFGFISQTLVGWQHKNISVSNCEVYNVPGSAIPANYEGSGIVLEGVDGGMIQYCVAHDNGQNNVFCGGPVGIWTLESNNITIQHCESYRNHSGSGCDGGGLDLDGGVSNSIMQYNYSHDNDGAGYLLGQYDHARPWSNNTLRYNISENDGVTNEGGIGLFKGPSTTMSGAYIYNNTIYISPQSLNPGQSASFIKIWNTGINNVFFYNNIFFSSGGVPLVSIPNGYSAFYAGNLYWLSGSPFSVYYQGIHYATLDSWRAATGNEKLSGVNTGFNKDPLLTNVGAGGTVGFGNSLSSLQAYKISSTTSPATNSAQDLSLFGIDAGTEDFWGSILPGGALNDIGSNQHSITLPIVLLGFHGTCVSDGNEITWVTAEELNMKSIELLYSADGAPYKTIAEIKPTGSNSHYSYLNESAAAGNNFYQLKMIDLDGVVSYSSVILVKCGNINDKITVGPNPFSHSIYISISSESTVSSSLTLYDTRGKLLAEKKVQLQAGINPAVFDGLGHLPVGMYYLQVSKPDKVERFKLIKSAE